MAQRKGQSETGKGEDKASGDAARPGDDPEQNGTALTTSHVDWRNVHLWQIQPVRDVLVVLAIFGVFYLGYMLRVVTVPILLALMLAYLFEPVVCRLTRLKWVSRQGAASIIIIAIVLVVLIPVTLGIGYGAVQGVGAARNLSRISANMLVVVDQLERQPGVYDEDNHFTGFTPDEDAPPEGVTKAENANAAYRDLPGLLKTVVRFYAASVEARQAADRTVGALSGEGHAGGAGAGEGEGGTNASGVPPPADPNAPGAGVSDASGVDGSDQGVAGGDPEALPPSRAAQPRVMNIIFGWLQANSSAIAGRAFGTSVDAAAAVLHTFASVAMIGFGMFLTGFFFFFFSSAYGSVLEFGKRLLPERNKDRTLELITKFDSVVAGFIRGRLTIAFILSILFTMAYWLIGVPAPLILGPIVGILSVVPYLSLVGLPLTIIALALEQHTGLRGEWWWILGAPIVVYQLVQGVDDYLLTPSIQGKTTDMDTPSIVFASIAGGVLAGFYGVLIAIPVAACLKIVIREIVWPQFKEWSEGRSRDFLPIKRE